MVDHFFSEIDRKQRKFSPNSRLNLQSWLPVIMFYSIMIGGRKGDFGQIIAEKDVLLFLRRKARTEAPPAYSTAINPQKSLCLTFILVTMLIGTKV